MSDLRNSSEEVISTPGKDAISVRRDVDRILAKSKSAMLDAGKEAAALASQYPDSFEAQMLGARMSNLHRQPSSAIAYLENAARLRPKDSTVSVNLGVSHFQNDDLEVALRYFLDGAESSDRRNTFPLTMAGRCCHFLGRPRAAATHYATALQWRKDDVAALSGLSRALRECGEQSEADRILDRLRLVLQRDPSAKRRYLLAAHYFGLGEWRQFDDKSVQARAIEAYRAKLGAAAFPWALKTYCMPGELSELVATHANAPGQWIAKPSNLYGAHGIRILEAPDQAPRDAGWIVQRYVANPLLIRDRKVTIRVYVLIASVDPLRAYIYNNGTVRFTPLPFRPDDIDEPARYIASPRRFESDEGMRRELLAAIGAPHPVWPLTWLGRELSGRGIVPDRLWVELHRLAAGFVDVLRFSGLFRHQSRPGIRFAVGPKIIGLDIQLDEELMPWLLEMEQSPAPWGMLACTNGRIVDDFLEFGFRQRDVHSEPVDGSVVSAGFSSEMHGPDDSIKINNDNGFCELSIPIN